MDWFTSNLQYLLLALLCVFFNVMDSVTTYIGLSKLPEQIKAEEGNPIAAWAFKRKWTSILFEIGKQSFIGGLAGYYVYGKFGYGLVFLATLFGIVVLNNTVTILMRIITKRKQKSPFFKMVDILGIPKRVQYLFVVIVIAIVSVWIAWVAS